MPRFGSYGWRHSNPDARDLIHQPPALIDLPTVVDLRPNCPPVYDQGQLGSCTANASCGAFEFDLLRQGLTDFTPSRLFQYYNSRVLSHDVHADNGSTVRDANKALAKYGVCSESLWPYNVAMVFHKPAKSDYKAALSNKITQYMRVSQDIVSMKATLAGGLPIQIGFTVYDSFESDEVAQTGIVPMPDLTSESVLGGHAVLICGFFDSDVVNGQVLSNYFIVRNSWSSSWGDAGYFYMPYAYFTNPQLASDLWVIQTVP